MERKKHRIKELRWDMGITQKQLAEATGIGYSTIQGYEQGTGIPSEQYTRKLAKFFNVSEEYLKGESDDAGREVAMKQNVDAVAEVNAKVNGLPIESALLIVDRLEKLVQMYKDGHITEEEYRAIKEKIIWK